jgi:outer membrane lipoprotein-sorting protein
MKYLLLLIVTLLPLNAQQQPDAIEILSKVDQNMASKNRVIESEMVIHGKRRSRSIVSKGYAEGDEKSFTEYLAPAREKGTKMLKLDERLWIYSPSTDRTIQLSGHMLRQSVMGSDLSYEDMMEDRKLTEMYHAEIVAEEMYNERATWLLELKAKVDDATYYSQKMWVDAERYIPLKQELYAKSGQMLKRITVSDVMEIKSRWYPRKMNYKDVLKDGKGTDFIVNSIVFDTQIPEYIFTKAALKR